MASPQSKDGSEQSEFLPFTKEERIRLLNDIDQSINQLLKSAGLAIQTLYTAQSSVAQSDKDRQQHFEENCNTYFRTLQTIDIGLHRQIHGLEEAGIIPADKGKKEKPISEAYSMTAHVRPLTDIDPASIDGGMGKFDIGLLNSQSGRVARDMEAELWEKARTILEKLDAKDNMAEAPIKDNDHDVVI